MKTKLRDFEVLIPNLDETAVADRVNVRVPVRWDEDIEQWILTPEAHEIIDNTKARHMGLLLPYQFRELRERHGYSQNQMGELFQVGEKSWTRWESGKHRPSRSINLMIRALYDGAISIDYLLKRAGKPAKPQWATAIRTFIASWHNALAALSKVAPAAHDLVYSAKPGTKLVLHVQTGHGKSEFLDNFVKLVEEQPDSTEQVMASQSHRLVEPRRAPSHTYPQPRLTLPVA